MKSLRHWFLLGLIKVRNPVKVTEKVNHLLRSWGVVPRRVSCWYVHKKLYPDLSVICYRMDPNPITVTSTWESKELLCTCDDVLWSFGDRWISQIVFCISPFCSFVVRKDPARPILLKHSWVRRGITELWTPPTSLQTAHDGWPVFIRTHKSTRRIYIHIENWGVRF